MKSPEFQIAASIATVLLYIWLVAWWWHFYGPSILDWWCLPAVLSSCAIGVLISFWPAVYASRSES